MLIEKRNCKYYYEEGYEPTSTGVAFFTFKDYGNGSNEGWIVCESNKEKANYQKIINNCGVANSNNLDYLLESGWTLESIHKTTLKKMSSNTHRITEDDRNFFHVDGKDFCHHTKEEALYWVTLEELK